MTPERLFRGLLRLLPFDFRADYGREMTQVFAAQHRDTAIEGRGARLVLWWATLRDILAIGPRAHLAQCGQDLRHALRGMRRTPGFTAAVVITLALGIGANTAIFSVVHAVLLRPLPYPAPDRLVAVSNSWDGSPRARLSDPEYLDYAERSRSVRLAAETGVGVNLGGSGVAAERVHAAVVTASAFEVLGVPPALGRGFRQDEEADGADRVAVLGHALWQRVFAADPGIVGRTITIDGVPREVVGVMPPGFQLPSDFGAEQPAELLLPLTLDRAAARDRRGGHYLRAFGRLLPGATLEAGQQDLGLVVAGLIRQYPGEHDQGHFAIVVQPLRSELLGATRPVLATLLAAAGLVLLVACANVANLLLARGETRRRELAIRSALGADRFRVVRQLLTESVLLSLAGAGSGLLLALACQRLVLAIDPATLPRVAEAGLSLPVLGFTAALATLAGIGFGLVPALQLSRERTALHLRDGGRGNSGVRTRARGALVVCQVGLALVLLVGAGLLVKSFARLVQVPSGLVPDRVLTLRVSLPDSSYPTQADVGVYFGRLLERVAALPGVRSAGAASGLPLSVVSGDWSFDVDGRPPRGTRHYGAGDWYTVMPGYFETLGIPLLAGRFPAAADAATSAPAIFINQTAARSFFPAGDALGQRMLLTGREQPWRTIEGVVADVRHRGLDAPPRPEFYVPLPQFRHFSEHAQSRVLTLVVATAGEPLALAPAVRAALRAIDPEVPAASVRDMRSVLAGSVADRRLQTTLVALFGGLALLLAGVGVYGVMAYQVEQRTRELGIRLALGASRGGVLRLVAGQGMRLVGAGLLLGVLAALPLVGLMRSLLFAVDPRDLTVFAGVGLVLLGVGALACGLPARRATRADPLVALRAD